MASTPKTLSKLSKSELSKKLQDLGEKTSGTKEELIERLESLSKKEPSNTSKKDTGKKRKRSTSYNEENNSTSDEPLKKKRKKISNIESKDEEIDDEDIDEDDDLKEKKKIPKDAFKIVCFNLNSIRAAHKKGLQKFIDSENADIYCFSETKIKQAENPCNFKGYNVTYYESAEKKGYAGTCIISKEKPISVTKGLGIDEEHGRTIILEYKKYYLINTYVPNSGDKLKFKQRRLDFDAKMKLKLKELQLKKPIIWTGDLNVAHRQFDVYDGETNKNRPKSPGFTDYERNNFGNVLNELNLIDTYAKMYPHNRLPYTFFSMRGKQMKENNKGWRLDYFVVSKNIYNLIYDIKIKNDINCSDHVPLILYLKNPDNNL